MVASVTAPHSVRNMVHASFRVMVCKPAPSSASGSSSAPATDAAGGCRGENGPTNVRRGGGWGMVDRLRWNGRPDINGSRRGWRAEEGQRPNEGASLPDAEEGEKRAVGALEGVRARSAAHSAVSKTGGRTHA
ncbi:hypothetical protein I4F81_010942 [Pyropia yezoensis]|uniref:Uncharacterized protein n=1 Tax=Pyropia yezoensis TaxID=2788 RepID=A0ACC3CE15_PYRYE|nr:hypothetical protein I4F81_010942 [Neopyropia yezoensis]